MVYSDEIKEHFFDPKNVLYEDESLFIHNARGKSGDSVCGEQMLMLLQIEDDKIKDIRWKAYGCSSAVAITSMLSDFVKGMNIKKAFGITPNQIADKYGGLPNDKLYCSIIGNEALQDAINDYLVKNERGKLKAIKKKSPKKCNSKS